MGLTLCNRKCDLRRPIRPSCRSRTNVALFWSYTTAMILLTCCSMSFIIAKPPTLTEALGFNIETDARASIPKLRWIKNGLSVLYRGFSRFNGYSERMESKRMRGAQGFRRSCSKPAENKEPRWGVWSSRTCGRIRSPSIGCAHFDDPLRIDKAKRLRYPTEPLALEAATWSSWAPLKRSIYFNIFSLSFNF